MASLFHALECLAACGADGLLPDARDTLVRSLANRRSAEGGFKGLDGRSDPYYTFFGWLSLRALRAPYDRDKLCGAMARHTRAANRVDAACARLLLNVEKRSVFRALLTGWADLWRMGDPYGIFLASLTFPHLPRWIMRRACHAQRRQPGARVPEKSPTPQLAAGLVLAALAGEDAPGRVAALSARHRAGGGFASAPGVPADLLATAVARFALRMSDSLEKKPGTDAACKADLAFIEACWLDDGLFGPFPAAAQGDTEHTFYGLLALGTCRPDTGIMQNM
ncbi:MAG TPA: prenyltransferase/squalene oxidase repeat-containing protein [Kiritimatiellia bacterium]|nr:prenyltransferase/squalene oxidase repeat-containing protein [Kiritimatiellia bacterium]